MYGACIYDAANFVTDGRTDGRTNKAILGVGLGRWGCSTVPSKNWVQKLKHKSQWDLEFEAKIQCMQNFIQKENEPFQRQHGSTKFSLSAGRKFLLLHSYLYPVFPQTFIIFLIFQSAQ